MTTAFQDMAPDGTLAQQELLFRGQLAKVAAPVLAWASLTNGYTFVTITPAGATDSRTINAALAASTDRPTFCAALAAELNTAGTTAYIWTVNTSSPVDGLIGTAKAYGSAYNSAPTGTALVGGAGSITTVGLDDTITTVGTFAPAGWADVQAIRMRVALGKAANAFWAKRFGSDAADPATLYGSGCTDWGQNGGGIKCTGGPFTGYNHISGIVTQNPKTAKWAIAWRGQLALPASGKNAFVSMVNSAGTKHVSLGAWNNSGQPGSTTSLTLTIANGAQTSLATSHIIDAASHDFMFTFDTIAVKCWVDGVLVGTQTTLTNFHTDPALIGFQGGGGEYIYATHLAFGYVEA